MKKSLLWIVVLVLSITMVAGFSFAGCKAEEEVVAEEAAPVVEEAAPVVEEAAAPVTLTYAIFSNEDKIFFQDMVNIDELYKEVKPNVTIALEIYKDSEDFETAMTIRKAGNELPDIMPLKPYMVFDFKDDLAPLDETEAAINNIFVKDYLIDGKALALPSIAFNEFVWYRKAIFEEYNLEIPKTWSDLLNVATVIRDGGKYIPIAMGGKDSWPDYPFNEYIPLLVSGDGTLWNTMGAEENPFAEDKPFYKALKMIEELYILEPFGPDPLGIGFDQATSIFVAGEAAMIAAGQWFVTSYENGGGDMADLGGFLMPVREEASDPLNATVMADQLLATPKNGENLEDAKDFINWYFSEDFYPGYINYRQLTSTVEGITSEVEVTKDAFENIGTINYVLVGADDENAKKLKDSIQFDVKAIGQQMMGGESVEQICEDLAAQWAVVE